MNVGSTNVLTVSNGSGSVGPGEAPPFDRTPLTAAAQLERRCTNMVAHFRLDKPGQKRADRSQQQTNDETQHAYHTELFGHVAPFKQPSHARHDEGQRASAEHPAMPFSVEIARSRRVLADDHDLDKKLGVQQRRRKALNQRLDAR